jgi:hypothetical protein
MSAPTPSRQLAFHQLLVAARTLWLKDALAAAVRLVDPAALKAELAATVPTDVQQLLAGAGIRDEQVMPTTTVLTAEPRLLGYYRLLLGVPQKSFYSSATGYGHFKKMESHGTLTTKAQAALPILVADMVDAMSELVRQISPAMTPRDVDELPILTLGSQFQGANNNTIGKQATGDVFEAIRDVVAPYVTSETETSLELRNAAGRLVVISLAADPDVRVEETFGETEPRRLLAIEIKGGTDRSNAHNRAGEAEKSHQKAKADGFRDFWTIIALKGLDLHTLRSESPTTSLWFDATQILGRLGPHWDDFVSRFAGEVGIPVPPTSVP